MPDKHDPEPKPRKFTRLSREHEHHLTETCFFCGKFAAGDALRNASTFDIDIHVRQCALKLQDKPLLAKLSAGDLIAQEAKYHPQCLTSLYNKARDKKAPESNVDDINHGIAFTGLVSYIEDVRMDSLCCTSVQTNGPGESLLYQAGTTGNTHDRAYTLHQTQEQNTELLPRHECSHARP